MDRRDRKLGVVRAKLKQGRRAPSSTRQRAGRQGIALLGEGSLSYAREQEHPPAISVAMELGGKRHGKGTA
ncbi:hypothetical protein BOSEA31B_10607 [Hyphomicrobiales bacterium]|nr:hypothetical protein BOSEA31B_10607 [Hyphomicrobiales bacterium]